MSASLQTIKMAALVLCTLASLTLVPARAQTSDNVIYLDQAWSQNDREWYWHFSQGSVVLGYDIFLNLEVADGQDLFRTDANLVRYGLIPDTVNYMNPDALPIGFSKQTVVTPIKGWPAGDYVGLTCAGCHSAQLKYKGKVIRIEGGGNNAIDMQGSENDSCKFSVEPPMPLIGA